MSAGFRRTNSTTMNSGWIDLKTHPPTAEDGDFILVWHTHQGVLAVRCTEWRTNHFFSHWQPGPASGWTDAAERRPGPEDCDVWGCVLVRHKIMGIIVTGWHRFDWDKYCTHWLQPPDPPPNYVDLQKGF